LGRENSAINKGYIAYFALRMREMAVFPKKAKILAIPFKADIGLLNICMGF